MSDSYVSFVSTDPNWAPSSDEQIEELVSIVADALPESEEIESLVHDFPAFVHPGENLVTVNCSKCTADLHEWFWELMEEGDYQGGPGPLDVEVPCCKQTVSLTELKLDWPGAFARFQIDAMNPEIEEIPRGLLVQLATKSGQEFRAVHSHF